MTRNADEAEPKVASKSDAKDDLRSLLLAEVEKRLGSSPIGLIQVESQNRLNQYGPNEIEKKKARRTARLRVRTPASDSSRVSSLRATASPASTSPSKQRYCRYWRSLSRHRGSRVRGAGNAPILSASQTPKAMAGSDRGSGPLRFFGT